MLNLMAMRGVLEYGTVNLFAVKQLEAGKTLIAPKNFGDPESWN